MVRPQFTPQQRAFIVAEFHRNNNNVYRVIQRFREVYPNARCPSRGTVYNNVRKYAITGTSLNLNKGRPGRNRTARSVENIEAVRNAIEETRGEAPEIRISCRRNGLGLSSATFQSNNSPRSTFSPLSNDKTASTSSCMVIFPDDSGFVSGFSTRTSASSTICSLVMNRDFR